MKKTLLLILSLNLLFHCSPSSTISVEENTAFTWTNRASWQKVQAENPKVVMLDVRTLAEWQDKHIDGAVHIPLNELKTRYSEIPKDIPVLIYCHSGNRSTTAANYLSSLGYSKLYNLRGGIIQW